LIAYTLRENKTLSVW